MAVIAVTGHKGRIGSELIRRGYIPLECDVTDLEQTNDAIHSVNPDVIIHCAAKTNVAWCEENEKEAFGVNVRGTANLFHSFGGIVIYLSTVHVFDGQKYFKYSERHKPNPLNVYGLTKFGGESVARLFADPARSVIVRTSSLFDSKKLYQKGLGILRGDHALEYTTLIKRSFAHVSHFVDGLVWLIDRLDEYPDLGLLHIAGADMLSYYDFWLRVADVLGLDKKLIIPRKHQIDSAPRPFRGGLSVRKAKRMGVPLFSSIDGLKLIKENME